MWCMMGTVQSGGELEQIQFLPGHVSDPEDRATPRPQAAHSSAVNDRTGIEP
jgi:hypothetical protein